MKTLLAFLLSGMFLFLAHTKTTACNLNPSAVMSSPDADVVYYLDTPVLLDATASVGNCGSIDEYRWRVRQNRFQSWVTVSTSSLDYHNFDIESSWIVELRVRNTAGNYSTITQTITVTEEPERFYYLIDHLGSVRVTVNDAGDPVGWDDYYPFGLQMPGRTQNASNPNDDAKFTGYLLEQEGDLGIYHAEARLYDPVIGRFMSVDPLALQYPSWSPYVYVMNNPVRYIDPDGREVRCRSEDDCNRAAQELNELHNNETNITVIETTWEEGGRFKRLFGLTETVEGFKLSTEESDFDFGDDDFTSDLYDVINTDEAVFYFEFVSGEASITGWPMHATGFESAGRNDARAGGGLVKVSADGNQYNIPTGVVIMHELVGHGHPNSIEANNVNRHYNAPARSNHGGYRPVIGWSKSNTGLYKKRNN